jgi:23S rRNA (adenine2503-C2)-methyltransferase
MKNKKLLGSFSFRELQEWSQLQGYPVYIAEQIFDWIYKKYARSFEVMSNVKKEYRQRLQQEFFFPVLKSVKVCEDKEDNVTKYLWELHDGYFIESVLIRSQNRKTLCVSSQVGCPVRCSFCASGQQGWKKNLTTAEILEQVLYVNYFLRQNREENISHVVFMGMGEPLLNYEAVVRAIYLLSHPKGLGISHRRITVSTIGVLEKIATLAEEGLPINLTISLHAPTQNLREQLIPFAKRYAIEALVDAAESYFQKTRRDITFAYVLIDNANANQEHAQQLCSLLRYKHCNVNLIPYNSVEGRTFRQPTKERIDAFLRYLKKQRIVVTCRYTKGRKVSGACGQLALLESKQVSV